jgi:hypothetical protein
MSVDLTIGDIRVRGEVREDAVIEVVRTAPDDHALLRIPVLVEELPDEVRVVGIQGDGGTDPALRTDVTIRLPRAAVVKSIRLLEGSLSLSALTGTVSAEVRRGPIDATNLAGVIRLETGIGNVTAREMRLSSDGLLRLRAFNGDVRLRLAERPTNARVMALALNGSIRSNIPLNVRDTWGPRWGEAVLGTGEPVISLDVITGIIEINAP